MSKNLYMKKIGERAKLASLSLSKLSIDKKNSVLKKFSQYLKKNEKLILIANKKDLFNAKSKKIKDSMIDRLKLNSKKIAQIRSSIDKIVKFKDPVGKTLSSWKRPNGLHFQKISVSIGVIGIIYESRPNVTVDASAISVKAGNSIILRGGKDCFYTSSKLYNFINIAFTTVGLPKNTVQMVPVTDRSAVDAMLKLDSHIDIIIPRGGKDLIKKIKKDSLIPVIKHLDGICHIYVDGEADLLTAKNVVFNSKMRRTGICGAAETLLIDKKIANNAIQILSELKNANCEIRGDTFIKSLDKEFKLANDNDWDIEYLDKIISVKVVDGVTGAIEHINKHSSGHTESIITENNSTFQRFYNNIDSAIILQNASTQFADGGEFGFGAEIGISTDKLHVRGPVGSEHLISYKYIIRGNGQVRQ